MGLVPCLSELTCLTLRHVLELNEALCLFAVYLNHLFVELLILLKLGHYLANLSLILHLGFLCLLNQPLANGN